VPAAKGLHLRGVHLGGRAASQDDFGFLGHAPGFEMMGGAANQCGLGGLRESSALRRECKGIDRARFMPAVALVQREVRREKKRPGGPRTGG
jgi:hypothetical protein